MGRTSTGADRPEFSITDTTKLKGWAIILMLMHHCFLEPERYKGETVIFDPFSEHFINSAALAMKLCVAIFVFISAYGITLSYKKACKGSFIKLTPKIIGCSIYRRGVKLWGSFFFVFILAQLYDLIVVRDGRYAYIYGEGIKSVIYFIVDALGLAELFHTPTYLPTFWFISLAWLIIFIVPVLLLVYSRLGWAELLFLGVLIRVAFPENGGFDIAGLPVYAFVVSVGIIAADKNLVVNISDSLKLPKALKLLLYILLFTGLFYTRQLIRKTAMLPVWDGTIALLSCVMFYEFFNRWPVIKDVLYQIGKYATYIFLIHNFIRGVWYYDFIYSFRYWWLILLVLLAVSFVISVLADLLKKYSGYGKLIEKLAGRQW